MLFDSKPQTRYEKQLENVDHLVLETIRKKNVNLTRKELNAVLEALWEWRVID